MIFKTEPNKPSYTEIIFGNCFCQYVSLEVEIQSRTDRDRFYESISFDTLISIGTGPLFIHLRDH